MINNEITDFSYILARLKETKKIDCKNIWSERDPNNHSKYTQPFACPTMHTTNKYESKKCGSCNMIDEVIEEVKQPLKNRIQILKELIKDFEQIWYIIDNEEYSECDIRAKIEELERLLRSIG